MQEWDIVVSDYDVNVGLATRLSVAETVEIIESFEIVAYSRTSQPHAGVCVHPGMPIVVLGSYQIVYCDVLETADVKAKVRTSHSSIQTQKPVDELIVG